MVVPVFITMGAHQVLFSKFHAGWFGIFGFAAWGNIKPEEEARSNGFILVAVGFTVGLLIQDWRGLLVGGGYVSLVMLVKRLLPKIEQRPLAWLTLIPSILMLPFLKF